MIRTVRDLIAELQLHPLNCDVVVTYSPTVSYPVLGVLEHHAELGERGLLR